MKKICIKCNELKEHEARGLCSNCYDKEHYQENKERIIKRKRLWMRNNPEKVRLINKKCRLKHKEAYLEKGREYYRKNKDVLIRKGIEWGRNHPESKKESNRKYYQKNKEKMKKYSSLYRMKNKDKRSEYERAYYKKFPEKQKERSQKYLHTPKGKLHTKKQNSLRCRKNRGQVIEENILKYGIISCENCKKECPENFNTDHIIPISKGGCNGSENLQVLCVECNVKKGVKIENYKTQNFQSVNF